MNRAFDVPVFAVDVESWKATASSQTKMKSIPTNNKHKKHCLT